MAQRAGLCGDPTSHEADVGVKEVIEDAARLFVGVSNGISGGGLPLHKQEKYLPRPSAQSEGLGAQKRRLHELMQHFKMHPAGYPLIAGGTTLEYGTHLVSELAYTGIPPKLYREGLFIVGDAAGFVINMGSTIYGMNLAIWRGMATALLDWYPINLILRLPLAEVGVLELNITLTIPIRKLQEMLGLFLFFLTMSEANKHGYSILISC